MTANRTVTVPTLDHGDIVIPEPAWCAGHTGKRPELRCDTGHTGPAHHVAYQGHELAYTALVQYPFSEHSDRGVGVVVELGQLGHRLTPDELDELAAVLVDYAGTLRHLARQLSVLQAEDGTR